MCSRNGRPVASLATPRPSRSTFTRIWVSFVLRVTSAVRISERFLERVEQYTVFIRRADRDAQAVGEAGVEVAHQHALARERLVAARGIGYAQQEEIGRRRKYRQPLHRRKRAMELRALGADLGGLRLEHLQMLEHES